MALPSLLSASIHLGLDHNGSARLYNFDQPGEVVISEEFRPRLNGQSLYAESVGGGVQLPDGRLLFAILTSADDDPADYQQGWKLYQYHANQRLLTTVAPLNRAMSSMAVGPNGDLYGVTFDPARFVQIDPETGHLTDLGAIDFDQSGVSPSSSRYGALVFEPHNDRFVFALKGPAGTFEIWSIAADGASAQELMHDAAAFYSPTDLLPTDVGLLMHHYGRLFVVDTDTDPVQLTPGERLTLDRDGPYGRVGDVPSAIVPLAGQLACVPSGKRLCLRDGGYRVVVSWFNPFTELWRLAGVQQKTNDSGAFWFVESSNLEAQVKVLDACGVNGYRWVFASASTDLAYKLSVREISSGLLRVYENSAGSAAPAINDVKAFPCS